MQHSLERLRERREERRGFEGGFTLIELLIVIVILGILAAIVVFAVSGLTGSSAQAACSTDFKTVETASEAYFAQVGVYPGQTISALDTAGATATSATGLAADTALLNTVLLSNGNTVGPWLQDDPVNAGHYQIGVVSTATGFTEYVDPAGTSAANAVADAYATAGTQGACSAVS